MIIPTKEDIGRGVVYLDRGANRREDGTLSSYNKAYCFVLYRGDTTPKATRHEDLEWL